SQHRVGPEIAVDLREGMVLRGFAARACDTGGGVDDEVSRVEQVRLDQGRERKGRGGRVTAGIRDQGCAFGGPVQLGKAVERLSQEVLARLGEAVKSRVARGIAQPEGAGAI